MDSARELKPLPRAPTLEWPAPRPGSIGRVEVTFAGESADLPAPPAYLIHGWLMDALARAAPASFAELHHRNAGRQPFTVTAKAGDGFLATRITWIGAGAGAGILTALNQESGREIRLAGRTFRATGVSAQSCAGPAAPEPDLTGRNADKVSRTIRLRFLTPTLFRHQEHDLLFPEPRLVFGSLVRSWNEHQEPLAPTLTEPLIECLAVSRYRLATTVVSFPRFPQRGFTGVCEYALVPWRAESWQLARFLGEFARFAGVGYKSSMGMGGVELVAEHRPRRRVTRGRTER